MCFVHWKSHIQTLASPLKDSQMDGDVNYCSLRFRKLLPVRTSVRDHGRGGGEMNVRAEAEGGLRRERRWTGGEDKCGWATPGKAAGEGTAVLNKRGGGEMRRDG